MSPFRCLLLCLLIGVMAPRLATADSPAIRNVLFIISDDLKASVLGCYGDRVCQTPNIDRLASQGVLFERAYCQGTACGPSRRSLMFSKYQRQGEINLGQHFIENGWYSARVSKIYHMRIPGDIIAGTNGVDVASSWTERFNSPGKEAHTPGEYACLNLNVFTNSLENRESTRMSNRMFVSVKYKGDGSDQPDHRSATKAIELLQKHQDEPFFLAVGFVRPHYPNVQPYQYFEPYPWQEMQLPESREGDLSDIPKIGLAKTQNESNPIGKYPDNQKRMWSAYYASVTFMDEQVGRVMDELDRLGLRDSTAVVFTSDHGYHLGEHGFWQKSNLHEEVLRVPLIMSVPKHPVGRSKSIVELVDIYPTLSELAGLKQPAGLHGTSVVPILKDATAEVKQSALSFNNGHSVRTKKWHYMRYRDNTAELYDMVADPKEFTNLATNATYTAVVEQLNQQLEARLTTAGLQIE